MWQPRRQIGRRPFDLNFATFCLCLFCQIRFDFAMNICSMLFFAFPCFCVCVFHFGQCNSYLLDPRCLLFSFILFKFLDGGLWRKATCGLNHLYWLQRASTMHCVVFFSVFFVFVFDCIQCTVLHSRLHLSKRIIVIALWLSYFVNLSNLSAPKRSSTKRRRNFYQ